MVRTLIGVTIIAIIEVVLLLRASPANCSISSPTLIVLAVIMLHTISERR